VIAAVGTVEGVVLVDVESGELIGPGTDLPDEPQPQVDLPRVVAASAAGSTVVAVVDRRPPLVVSHDGGRTWQEAGGGLPVGFAVAVAEDDPDRVLYAARNRLFLSRDGGRFWASLEPELPDIQGVAWL
jgi:hypothetical protein